MKKLLIFLFLFPSLIKAQHVPSWHDDACGKYAYTIVASAYSDGGLNMNIKAGMWGTKEKSKLGAFIGFETYMSGNINTNYNGVQNSIEASPFIQPLVKIWKTEIMLQYISFMYMTNAPPQYNSFNYTISMGDKYLLVSMDFNVGLRMNGLVTIGAGLSIKL